MSIKIKPIIRQALEKLTSINVVREILRKISKSSIFLFPDDFWQRFPVGVQFTVKNPTGHNFLYSSHRLEPIGRSLYWRGIFGYEPETIKIFTQLIKKFDVFIDVGSNTGLFSLLAASIKSDMKIFAFEPVPFTRNLIVNNIKINEFQQQITVLENACSDCSGVDKFYVPDGTKTPDVQARLATNNDLDQQTKLIEVQTIMLDEFVFSHEEENCFTKSNNILVKIDVEGFEDKVLVGMSKMLDNLNPVIIFECNPGGPADAITSIFKNKDYTLFSITQQGLISVDTVIPDSHLINRNFLAVPLSKFNNSFIETISDQIFLTK